MSKKEIDRLTTKLKDLEIRQNSLTSEIATAKEQIQELRDSGSKEKKEVVIGSQLYQGDTVTILNPSPRQTNKGTVCGVTKDGLIKIQPKEGKVIRRLPKNLEKQL